MSAEAARGIVPSVLILASRGDFTCDYVVSQLMMLGVPYLRLNVEDLPALKLSMYPTDLGVEGELDDMEFAFSIRSESLRSVLFRRPIYLRESEGISRPPIEQLTRTQWSTFVRSFMVFDDCRWMNHPSATFQAENKAVQLAAASQVGLRVPHTIITNSKDVIAREFKSAPAVVVKGLDTVLVREGDLESFGYTQFTTVGELLDAEISSAPVIVQEALRNKLDLRVTVVGTQLFCASIMEDRQPIQGDWRRSKDRASFMSCDLPCEIGEKCVQLAQAMGLAFGAIDLAVDGGDFYFLEINPTGEWAWLVDQAGLPIDRAVAEYLACRC